MAALKKISNPIVKVRRGGSSPQGSSTELVPGDVILLEAGDSIPADARLVEACQSPRAGGLAHGRVDAGR